ncbi:flavoprotein [Methylogaea oryzae]|uniref:flavoprotein n=1 Tax=Methylogaea oryzae TaxID=1295382 RepID=UPI00357138F9
MAPATAHCLAKLRAGLADDLLSTLCLATEAPILLAPAMNRAMWANRPPPKMSMFCESAACVSSDRKPASRLAAKWGWAA